MDGKINFIYYFLCITCKVMLGYPRIYIYINFKIVTNRKIYK